MKFLKNQVGGHNSKCALNESSGRCKKDKVGDDNCENVDGRCKKVKSKPKPKTPAPKPKPKPKPKTPAPKPKPKQKPKTKSKSKQKSPKIANSGTDSDSIGNIIPKISPEVVPEVDPEVVQEVVPETQSIAVIYWEDIGAELDRVRLTINGKQRIYKLGLPYMGGTVKYYNLYKDDGELSIEGRCIVKVETPGKMDIHWAVNREMP